MPGNKQPPVSISVVVFHRGPLSLGAANKERLGPAIFHWAIMLHPSDATSLSSKSCTVFDATDGVRQDPITFLDTNLDHDWFYRVREDFNPLGTANFLGGVVVGEIPSRRSAEQVERIRKLFDQNPLPGKNKRPFQNCVSWAKAAVVQLQREGLVEERPGGVEDIEAIWGMGVTLGERIITEGLPDDEEKRLVRLVTATTTAKHERSELDRFKGLFTKRSTAHV